MDLKKLEVWFVTGSQHLYGEETLRQVAEHSKEIAAGLNASAKIPVSVVFKPVLTTPEGITDLCVEANSCKKCIGIITWMHTFSPSKMWINGLKILNKPVAHLHTQYNRDIPWSEMDMDFMNLNQSAHGDREHGFIFARLRKNRKVVVGYWKDEEVRQRLGVWSRACAAWFDWQGAKFARFGDNMREVAVTEGDKVEAQLRFGFSVNYFPLGDLVRDVDAVTEEQIDKLYQEYDRLYHIASNAKPGAKYYQNVRAQARIELGMRKFLEDGDFKGFTTTFEDLYGLTQLPGLAVQRLMADGYGFGAEGDWKQSALVRAMKVMSIGLPGGVSFMEDYTYHFDPRGMKELGSHMLEVCPSIGDGNNKIEVHPLGIGGKEDPARMVFNVPAGEAVCASIVDMGNRFRMILSNVDVVVPEHDLPKLPVARALWVPRPNLQIGAGAWILAGGAHHTGFSKALTAEYMEDFCEIADIEFLSIDEHTNLTDFKKELRWNEMYYLLNKALK